MVPEKHLIYTSGFSSGVVGAKVCVERRIDLRKFPFVCLKLMVPFDHIHKCDGCDRLNSLIFIKSSEYITRLLKMIC